MQLRWIGKNQGHLPSDEAATELRSRRSKKRDGKMEEHMAQGSTPALPHLAIAARFIPRVHSSTGCLLTRRGKPAY